jgi:hypothetical protein
MAAEQGRSIPAQLSRAPGPIFTPGQEIVAVAQKLASSVRWDVGEWALTKAFANGWPSLGLFADEGGQFIGGHGMSDDAKLRTATGLSRLWDDRGKTDPTLR